MKILMLLMYPLYGSGSGTYTFKLAENLAKNYPDDNVAVFCPDTRKIPHVKTYFFEMPFKAVATSHPDWPNAKTYSSLSNEEIDDLYVKTLGQVIKVVRDFKPDVIHVHHAFYFSWIADYIRAVYGTYYVITTHGTELLTASENKRWIPLTKDALARAWKINAVSGDTKKWLLRIYGRKIIESKTKVITGGVDLKTFNRNEPIRIINKKYNLSDKKVVIFSGKLTAKKGIDYLIKAAPKIKGEIFIIGGGEVKEQLEQLAKDLNAKNVHFLGYFGPEAKKEFYEFYRRADVFVFPSVWDEPLGLVALEAMASSTPVVASKKGGIPLAVKNNINGFLVRARSSNEIAKKVNLLLRDENLRKRMGEAARKIVEEKFNWAKIAVSFHEFYAGAFEASKERLKKMRLPLDYKQEFIEIKGRKLDYK